MPELPEVETIKNALIPHLVGRAIRRVEVFSPKLREPITPLLDAALEGRRITGVRRRARYFLIDLDDGRVLLGHLGMSGVLRIEPESVERRKHEHLFLHLDDGMIFRFECTRRFSSFKVCTPARPGTDPAELGALGVEPLSEAFTGAMFYQASRNRRGPLKVFLMDNSIVVGVGNIYATEALFAARLSPLRAAGSLSRRECDVLAVEVKRILAEAIELGGSTIHDFKHVDGSEGQFALQLQVYGKGGRACPVCGATLEIKRLGGRSSCYCPRCQV